MANFGENQPFRGAEMVYPTMSIMRRGKTDETFHHYFMEGNVAYAQLIDTLRNAEFEESLAQATSFDEWRFQSKELTLLYQKIIGAKTNLLTAVESRIYYGILTGRNEAFYVDSQKRQELINEHPSSNELIKPIIRGQHLRPWYQMNHEDYVLFTRQGVDIDSYPAVKRHLSQYREVLEPRPEGHKGEWLGRTAGNYM